MTDYCCDLVKQVMESEGKWMLGSHYHCSQCDGLCSMMGHWREYHFKGGKPVKVASHYCCTPATCEVK